MKTTDLLSHVFDCAISDRQALADAYDGDGEHAADAREDARKFQELRKKLITGRASNDGPAGLKRTLARPEKAGEIKSYGLDELREIHRHNILYS